MLFRSWRFESYLIVFKPPTATRTACDVHLSSIPRSICVRARPLSACLSRPDRSQPVCPGQTALSLSVQARPHSACLSRPDRTQPVCPGQTALSLRDCLSGQLRPSSLRVLTRSFSICAHTRPIHSCQQTSIPLHDGFLITDQVAIHQHAQPGPLAQFTFKTKSALY